MRKEEANLAQPNDDAAFEKLIRYIQESRGIDFRGYKRTSLRRRIALRMEHLHVDTSTTITPSSRHTPRNSSICSTRC